MWFLQRARRKWQGGGSLAPFPGGPRHDKGWWRGGHLAACPRLWAPWPGGGRWCRGRRGRRCGWRAWIVCSDQSPTATRLFGKTRGSGTSGFASPVKVWCGEKLNEPYCKDFSALRQKIFNTLCLSCRERSFPSAARGSVTPGLSLGLPQHVAEQDQARRVRRTHCRTDRVLGWDPRRYHPAVPPSTQSWGGGKRRRNAGYAASGIGAHSTLN